LLAKAVRLPLTSLLKNNKPIFFFDFIKHLVPLYS